MRYLIRYIDLPTSSSEYLLILCFIKGRGPIGGRVWQFWHLEADHNAFEVGHACYWFVWVLYAYHFVVCKHKSLFEIILTISSVSSVPQKLFISTTPPLVSYWITKTFVLECVQKGKCSRQVAARRIHSQMDIERESCVRTI